MFSVNNFYDYLRYKYSDPEKNIIYKFRENGSRDLFSLHPFNDNHNPLTAKFLGGIYLFDQEPFCINNYHFDKNAETLYPMMFAELEYNINLVSAFLSKAHTPIICHSEKNSNDINKLKEIGFLDVHYWYHGLIARDWFRHWKHYNINYNPGASRFGLYVRDTSGSREYRKDLLKELHDVDIYCPFINGELFNSTESARITWDDTNKFDIHIVAETLFNTEKVHLTEKIFKPIVMKQPFILFAGPHSLRYLKKYGFKTFEHIWNEEYDDILDAQERLNQATKMIKRINKLPKDKYNKILEQCKEIVEYNHNHFFSQKFEDIMLGELHSNFDIALQHQEENFLQDPGGIWFRMIEHYTNLGHSDLFRKDIIAQTKLLIIDNHPDPVSFLKQYPWDGS